MPVIVISRRARKVEEVELRIREVVRNRRVCYITEELVVNRHLLLTTITVGHLHKAVAYLAPAEVDRYTVVFAYLLRLLAANKVRTNDLEGVAERRARVRRRSVEAD